MEKGHVLYNHALLQRESQKYVNRDLSSSPLLKAELTSNSDQVAQDLLQMCLNVSRGGDSPTSLFKCFITCTVKRFS